MARKESIDWNALALSWGYTDVKQMLLNFYYVDEYSLRDIANFLKVSFETVRKKFKEVNIDLKQKGGNNKTAWKKINASLRSGIK